MVLLCHALDENNNFVTIHDVRRGQKNLKCRHCGGKLIARKGEVVSHHFAHSVHTCNYSKNATTSLPLYDYFDLGLKPEIINPFFRSHQIDTSTTAHGLKNLGLIEFIEYCNNEPSKAEYTDLGLIVLGSLSLQSFNKIQESRCMEELEKLEANILWSKNSNPSLLKRAISEYNIYRLHYRRILLNHLFFVEIEADGKKFYQIGNTQSDSNFHLTEIKQDLSRYFDVVSIKGLGLWFHRGNVEHYFKHRYRKAAYVPSVLKDSDLPTSRLHFAQHYLTEYFQFDDICSVLQDLQSMEVKYINSSEQKLLDNLYIDDLLQSLYIRDGMKKSEAEGIHVGRPSPSFESRQQFLAKPKTQAVVAVLKKGLSLRRTAMKAGVSVNTVRKVKTILSNKF